MIFVRRMVYVMVVLLTATFTSCDNVTDFDEGYVSQRNQPNSGTPVITGVFAIHDADQLVPLVEAEPGQRLCIAGQNLNHLKSLKFNTVEANLDETFTLLTKAIVKVPSDYSKNHVNVIEYTTDMGTAQYDFVVALPSAEIGGLQNEFATAGSDVMVAGKNLQYYDFTLTLNGEQQPLTIGDGSLSFHIPEGTPDNSVFVISWVDVYGGQQTMNMPFRPTSDMLFGDISKAEQQMTDRNVSIETSDLGTSCLYFSGTISEYAWVELSFGQPLAEAYDAENVNQYNFVFEVNTAQGHPLLDTGYEFALNWDWDNSCRWNPETLDTEGGWQTVRLPLEAMAPNGLGPAGSSLVLNVGFQPYSNYEPDFRMANFRIEKK